MKQKRIFLFFCMIFVAKVGFSKSAAYLTDTLGPLAQLTASNKRYYSSSLLTYPSFSKKQVVDQWGWFCKKEWKMEKVTGIPFRFRLGSVDDCNWMEGKKGWYRQP